MMVYILFAYYQCFTFDFSVHLAFAAKQYFTLSSTAEQRDLKKLLLHSQIFQLLGLPYYHCLHHQITPPHTVSTPTSKSNISAQETPNPNPRKGYDLWGASSLVKYTGF